MPLEITWTRTAIKIPSPVRKTLEARLGRLHRYFPEIRPKMKIGITRAYEGSVFQAEDGFVKLMLEVRRTRDGRWKLPTYWTMAHELMHLAQFNTKGLPGGERACDVYAMTRLPPRLIDESPSYLTVPKGLRGNWEAEHARIAHEVAVQAIQQRSEGLRRYANWWETEFERRVLQSNGKGRSKRMQK
ncbi:MAG: hypothetical protein KKE24_05495 [Candidatus Thermoplasmatota archaeon]|nr:hypothetical protein [Candidatus Thermoplasmatota archaeon]